ncbi:Response regulator receiver domain protein (CheY) [Trichormus variabilis ATCC 29413]|uniref:Response regulator receiver domain protein (CheY) n=3 Tax=Anabaena variabilis TaxID=264691 RepID=Q3MH45_TRIV2|nr:MULTISPECIES: response regulator [Nostocaceae]MBC1258634.1 response regulator [Trichormus variabilis V5]ABA19691.1 Response regulator receiver domain protein (CheY) [Trichormus variabilis ATCC 29413]MBC1213311.1 response regulator [Trichormus variabilis ARAD]MBC1265984.1 response regulator [Trichormus variabilis FSR]MBC1302929.1 response regulator [Trichormus variabilis N2B]
MTKILVIEDQEEIRSIIVEMLTAENFYVMDAENGQVGITLLQTEIPDLIICDIAMPKIDGYEVVTWSRENPETEAIPFIFLTAKASQNDIRQGIELGADDYLVKPFTRAELLGAITARLEKQEIINRQTQQRLHKSYIYLTSTIRNEVNNPLNYITSISEKLINDYEFMNREEILKKIKEIYNLSKNFQDGNLNKL